MECEGRGESGSDDRSAELPGDGFLLVDPTQTFASVHGREHQTTLLQCRLRFTLPIQWRL